MLNKWRSRARPALRAAAACALPQHCALCSRATGDAGLCAACAAAIATVADACPVCALPSPSGAEQVPPDRRYAPFPLEGGRALGRPGGAERIPPERRYAPFPPEGGRALGRPGGAERIPPERRCAPFPPEGGRASGRPVGAICGRCLAHPPAWDAAIAAGAYAFPLDRLIMRLKYAADLPLAATLGERLAHVAASAGAVARVDALVPMPLAPARQRERGCNQAREIARAAGAATGLPLVDALRRTRHAVPQASLEWRERARNVRGAFAARGRLDGARLALVDDVMTSGATAAAASSVLRRAGAAHVEVWVVARTLPA